MDSIIHCQIYISVKRSVQLLDSIDWIALATIDISRRHGIMMEMAKANGKCRVIDSERERERERQRDREGTKLQKK